jgi:NAD(P)-dependent dehydrogenase (short-subunit alcohol dehydrogenase family)
MKHVVVITGASAGIGRATVRAAGASDLDRVLSIDTERKIARLEPGVVLDTLQREAARHRLIFGPDPATHHHCTLGGMLGNNSCGVDAVMSQFRPASGSRRCRAPFVSMRTSAFFEAATKARIPVDLEVEN